MDDEKRLLLEASELYDLANAKPILTRGSTDPDIVLDVLGERRHIHAWPKEAAIQEIARVMKEECPLGSQNVVGRFVSEWKWLLSRARRTLLEDVLPASRPDFESLKDVIIDAGTALNNQIDKSPDLEQKRQGIERKLTILGLRREERSLFDRLLDLNIYFEAVRHRDDPKNAEAVNRLLSDEGKTITADYFETARRVFVWYYAKFSAQPVEWDEIAVVDYALYGLDYRYPGCNH